MSEALGERGKELAARLRRMIKIVFCLRRKPELSREEFQEYWRTQHAPLVQARAEALGSAVTCRSTRSTTPSASPSRARATRRSRSTAWPSSGSTVSRRSAPTGAPTPGRAAAAALLDDERRFIDLERSPLFLAEEHVIIG